MTFNQEKYKNIRKTWILVIIFLIIVITLGYYISEIYQSTAILYTAIGLSFFQVLISYFFSKNIALKSNGAKKIKKKNYPDLYNSVENLSRTSRIPMPSLYIINDNVPNAFATGRSPKKAAIAVTTGLINIMNKKELEGVIAHELSHIKNYDILISSFIVVLVGFLTIGTKMFKTGNLNKSRQSKSNLIFIILLVFFAPIIGIIIQLAISRKREYLADASAAIISHNPSGLANALEKLSKYSGKMKRANIATSHMFINNSFGIKKNNIFNEIFKLFSTHPPIKERIKRLKYR